MNVQQKVLYGLWGVLQLALSLHPLAPLPFLPQVTLHDFWFINLMRAKLCLTVLQGIELRAIYLSNSLYRVPGA